MKVIIITGSRDWSDERPITRAVVGADLVVHGGCRGADRMAECAARCQGIPTLPMPANWDRYGRSAGPRRNQRIVEVAVALADCGHDVSAYAFPLRESRGTYHCANALLEAGIKVTYVDD